MAKEKFVTKSEFDELSDSVNSLVGLVKQQMADAKEIKEKVDSVPKPTEVITQEKKVDTAGPKPFITPVNPEWEALARDIIGTEKIERVEMEHVRSGGLIFTIVIKKEFSNAPDAYLALYKEDKRSKEIGAEGIAGVESWAKLIAQNLKRGKTFVSQ